MKKDFGVKTWLYPMPVLMIATYNADGSPNVMNAACDETALADGKPDAEKIAPITFDPVAHVYRPLAAPIAQAFRVGIE